MMQKIKSALVGALLLWTPLAANAAEPIQFNPGGSLIEYIQKFEHIRTLEGRLVIDGLCISACTLVTGLVPRDRVCTTEFGKLAFHSSASVTPAGRVHSSEGTRLLWELYPADVQEYLRGHGWDGSTGAEHAELIYMPADAVFQSCINVGSQVPDQPIQNEGYGPHG